MAAVDKQEPVVGGDAAPKNPFNDEFAKFAKETMEEWKVPGFSIAVVDDQDVFAEVSCRFQYRMLCSTNDVYVPRGMVLRRCLTSERLPSPSGVAGRQPRLSRLPFWHSS